MRIAFAVLAVALVSTTPAHAEVTAQSGSGFAVSHTVTVSVDPEAAFAMLRTPAKWWDKEHTWTGSADNLYMDAQAGGCFCELIPNEATTESGAPQRTLRGSVQHMQILYVDPGKLLRMSGALGPLQGEAMTGTMTIALAPIKGGTRLTVDYVAGGFMRMPQDAMATAVDGVIGAQASRLAMALGPLVGGGKGEAPTVEDDATEADAGEGETAGPGSVGSLVADLEPDEDASGNADSEKPVAAPPKAKTPTAARPAARPARERNDDEGGR
ncbi:SRPBCC family protein [Blastomonas sp.]|uniref:SRPBCC family protein n=1 Tax=Blastomonas sp. TaxID=1909299 RepID=UPI002634F31D|nr:SRPBCC family protein [Blastomonas sp.]MDM7957907.1 SRPBCC family protein [Blastomonas sp.]